MKLNFTYLYFVFFSFFGLNAQFSHVNVTPYPFEVDQQITITVNLSQPQCNNINPNSPKVYIHTGIGTDANPWSVVQGNWGQDDGVGEMTNMGGSFSISFIPKNYFNLTPAQEASFTRMGMVFRNATGSQQMKLPPSCGDFFINVGTFQVNLTAPQQNSTTVIASGSNFNIAANNTGGVANYVLKANGTTINTQNNVSTYNFTHTNITSNQSYVLEVTQGSTTITRNFNVVVNPGLISQAIPAGLQDGVNYGSDPTKVTLVLNAPFKDFIYVAGSFNDWQPTSAHAMKKDTNSNKFWLEIDNLVPEQWYAYQYWVGDQTNLPVNSPALVKTADPFSTLVLSPFDDPEIIQLGVYPGLPVYNNIAPGQEREVSVIQTGSNTYRSYNWSQATLNFQKPAIKDLVIYEVLVRDFDQTRTYQDLIDKIDYFKNLNVNAIQLMPVMEFEGNMSWGYNTVYHLAPDKRYGPPAKLKEFVDLCHQNGMAVILDVALNHVFGRSPLERMWMIDTNGNGWSNGISAENPYCNVQPMHSYNVGADLDHFREPENLTNTYTLRTIRHWIEEYKIDGYRWDLTKGFTNACPPGPNQETCTNGYIPERVAKLKWYADYQWSVDNTSYVIFEHLGFGGSRQEELEWAAYRINEGKGIMFWHKMTDHYANLIKGNANGINDVTVFGDNNRAIGYAESHDEERVIYKAINEAGQTQNNLNKALLRLRAQGAVHLLVPGPKMIWHFGELGWNLSLWTCENGTVSFSNPDCKLDTKPQPQWANNWMSDTNRNSVYNDWAKMNDIRINNDVFENGQFAWNMSNSSRPRLDVWTSTQPQSALSYVIVLTNFTDVTFNATGGFPYTGTWVNLMDDTTFNVSNTNMTISIEPGGYRVFGNQEALSTDVFDNAEKLVMYPNPARDFVMFNKDVFNVEVYNVTGQRVKFFNGIIHAGQAFDINNLNSGVYIVKSTDDNGQEHVSKFVKP